MCFNWFSRVKNRSSALISSAMSASCVPGYASKCRQARFREGVAFGDSAGGVFSCVFAGFLPGRLSWPMSAVSVRLHAHEIARHGALLAGCRAGLAMVVGMLAAFVGAGLADLGAQAADVRRMRALARHCGHGQFADLRAFQVLGNAGGHHLDV